MTKRQNVANWATLPLAAFVALAMAPANVVFAQKLSDPAGVGVELVDVFLVILQGKNTAAQLPQNTQVQIRTRLARIDIEAIPLRHRRIARRCRDELLTYIGSDMKTVFEAGTQLLHETMADLDISATLLRLKLPQSRVDGAVTLLWLAKVDTLLKWGASPSVGDKVKPQTRFFVDYYVILSEMIASSVRPVQAQAALLSLEPEAIPQEPVRREFLQLQSELSGLSRSIEGPASLVAEKLREKLREIQRRRLLPLVKTLAIDGTELESYGGARVHQLIQRALRD